MISTNTSGLQAKDLRIGNYATIDNPKAWPKVKGIPMRVTGIEEVKNDRDFPASTGSISLFCEVCEYENEYNQFDEFIQPIPLSEDWLLRAGFKRLPNWQDSWMFNGNFSVNYHRGYWHWNDLHSSRKLEYVHQFQNLYFCLTGEELTIK